MEVWKAADYALLLYILAVIFLRHSEFGRRRNLPTDLMLEIGAIAFALLVIVGHP
ncbi:hypothetical protein [Thermococcus sp. 9N3]|uniref:hypothetical protein n=1 Tax=Thermococcus sp. 9N3 TaxID=163002 RepID=UPI0014307EC7|nr:hypothetical protein [Thermococcus sp. 9N3]